LGSFLQAARAVIISTKNSAFFMKKDFFKCRDYY